MSRAKQVGERLRTALDLADIAEEMLVQRLRREQPALSDEEIARRVALWYEARPGAQFGDADGQPGQWPRKR